MPKIHVTDREGETHALDGVVGWSVMEIIRENDLPIEAACGGCCACATCHIYVDEAWLGKLDAPESDENLMLDEAFEVAENSRLGCQIRFTDAMDGMKVTLAPEF